MLNDTCIMREIDINKTHITNFPIETDKGTKKMKETFYKNAVNNRNNYILKEKTKFIEYQKRVYFELNSRVLKMFPNDNSDIFLSMQDEVDKYERIVIGLSDDFTVFYKLGLNFLLSDITDETSLEQLNLNLIKFINLFKCADIILNVNDFNYTMFTKKYMDVFFENFNINDMTNSTKNIMDEIYFESPTIITQLKFNLVTIMNKYRKELEKYLDKINTEMLKKYDIDILDFKDIYMNKRQELFLEKRKDSFNILNIFLKKGKNISDYLMGSNLRNNIFNLFLVDGEYNELSDNMKNKYNMAIKELDISLNGLKEYYRYEEIIKDLVKRYKDNKKDVFLQKQKELDSIVKNKSKLYKNYLKYSSGGFLKKIDLNKARILKLNMNEEFNKIKLTYDSYIEVEIDYLLNIKLNEASSIYHLLTTSLLSYSYLENKFISLFGEEEDFSLEKEFLRFIKFIYNPNNNFLHKINGLTDYNISEIIADKYRLLDLNVKASDIEKDNIDIVIDNVNFIMTILNIADGNLGLEKMYFIYQFKNIIPIDGWEKFNLEII